MPLLLSIAGTPASHATGTGTFTFILYIVVALAVCLGIAYLAMRLFRIFNKM